MINSQINILAQARRYLNGVTPEQYCQVVTPLFISSAGQHLRHILDHYSAIIDGLEVGVIDYDKRSRGGEVEVDIAAAVSVIAQIECFLRTLSAQQLASSVQLSTEVDLLEKQVERLDTTLARELLFAGSHAIHHFAMIEQIAKIQKVSTPCQFGIAPATSTVMRDTPSVR